MLNFNEHNFKVGDRAVIDEGRPNSCEVVIEAITPSQMFADIKADDGYEWVAMMNRLTPIKNTCIVQKK